MRRWMAVLLVAAVVAFSAPAQIAEVQAQEAEVVSGLPQRTPPPRTLEAYWPVFAGLSVTWLAIMGYYLSMSARAGRISRGISAGQNDASD